MSTELLLWIAFHVVVVAMLALDLGVLNRRPHVPSLREAAAWSALWVAVALGFAAGVWQFRGGEDALLFVTGYVVEKSLGVDNIFVFLMIFAYFAVPAELQPKVLKWGVLGALLMRAAFIAAGAVLVERFHWILYLFGAFLVLTAIRMLLQRGGHADLGNNRFLEFLRARLPLTEGYEGSRFTVKRAGKRYMTPLLLVLLMVELSDLVFAVDSVPAIFAITTDPFLVYTSNVLAVLGLRSLFFLLAGVVTRFQYLKTGLAAILGFVGAKMLLLDVYKVPVEISLLVIVALLASSIGASLLASHRRSRGVGAWSDSDGPSTHPPARAEGSS